MKYFKTGGFHRKLQLASLWIVVPLLAVAIFLHAYLIGPLQRSYQELNNRQVEGIVSNINQQFSQLEVTLSVWGQSFQRRYQEDLLETTNYQTLIQLSEELFYLTNSSNYVNRIGIYSLGESPFGIESGGTYELTLEQTKTAFERYRIDNGRQYQWKIIEEEDELIFVQNIDSQGEDQPKIFLVATIDEQSLLKYFYDTQIENGLAAISFNHESFRFIGDQNLANVIQPLSEEHQGTWVESINGNDYSMIAVNSTRLNQIWTFYTVVPLALITEPVTHLARVLIVVSILFIACVAVMSLFLAKKQYQPFEKTMDQLFGNTQWKKENDLEFLVDRWQQLSREKGLLQNQAERFQDSLKRQVIQHLMEGYYGYLSEEESQQLLQQKNWRLSDQGYRLFYFQLNDLLSNQANSQDETHILFALENIIADVTAMFFPESTIVSSNEGRILVFVINQEQQLTDYFTMVTKQINLIVCRYVTIVSSQQETEIRKLPEVAQRLKKQIHLQQLIPENQVLQGENMRPLPKYSLSQENLILTALKSGYHEELQRSVQRFLEQVVAENNQQAAVIYVVNRMYDQVDYLLNENGVSRTDYVSKTVVLERIERLLDINQIQAFLYHHFLKPVSILWQENVANSYSEMIQKVAEYIQSDFRNEQISLEYVADRFEVDPIFLSKEFKRAKQVNFIDYLTNVRIVEAKRQLLETDHQINEIAENLGYNPSYFNRLFKKCTGMTPGQYRKGQS
ncbi:MULTISPECIES: helix-turn-helix transcriptional regulator [Enterococcus]|uniref:helix-turn-helix transcriptional regulator n=1 Tax=Enterococcus TaxID=1350 RepID=UPI0022E3C4C8|nr:helix-turn-helix transcriptional regulator [Enterococcus casseliflavus]